MTIPVELPPQHLKQLRRIAHTRKATITEVAQEALIEWIDQQEQPELPPSTDSDSVWGLVGAYESSKPLIDGIAASEDPDLYLVAEALGERAAGLHAWEIAPKRYTEGPNGKPIRLHNGNQNSI
jgi:hypothetical protein